MSGLRCLDVSPPNERLAALWGGRGGGRGGRKRGGGGELGKREQSVEERRHGDVRKKSLKMISVDS